MSSPWPCPQGCELYDLAGGKEVVVEENKAGNTPTHRAARCNT